MLNPIICAQCLQPNEPARTICWKCMRSTTIPPSENDYLRLYNLQPNWTMEELKAAFRLLARKYHPDVHPGDREADAYFKFVNEAYEVLSRVADHAKKEQASKPPTPTPPAPVKPAKEKVKAKAKAEETDAELNAKLNNLIQWSKGTKAHPAENPTMLNKLTHWLGHDKT